MRPYLVTRILARNAAHIGAWVGYMFVALGVLAACSILAGCATLPKDDPRVVALGKCESELPMLVNLVPYELLRFQCMERAGWVQRPLWNSLAVDRYVPR